jgi:hypothetical protein
MISESKFKLYELFPAKTDKILVFNFEFLITKIFTTPDIKEIDKKFENYKILRTDINNIVKQNGFNKTKIEILLNQLHGDNQKAYTVNYTYNILNYMIHNNIILDANNIMNLLSYNNLFKHNNITTFQKGVLDKLPNIIEKINNDNLKIILKNIFENALYVRENLNFIKTYCKYDKYNENNINELIKDSSFHNFPFEMFPDFYSGNIDNKICNLLFLIKYHTFIRNIIKIMNDEYETNLKN